MWLWKMWHCKLVHGVHKTLAKMAAVSCGTSHAATRQHCQYTITINGYIYAFRITCDMSALSLLKSRIVLYKKSKKSINAAFTDTCDRDNYCTSTTSLQLRRKWTLVQYVYWCHATYHWRPQTIQANWIQASRHIMINTYNVERHMKISKGEGSLCQICTSVFLC